MNNNSMNDQDMLAAALINTMPPQLPQMTLTMWDVGHGLSIWIQTPNGQNHWIDAGWEMGFCPAEHASEKHFVTELDYLIISHPDQDHIQGLTGVIEHIGEPRALLRNKTLTDEAKFGSGLNECQKIYKSLDTRFTQSIDWPRHPQNPSYNGGISIETSCLDYTDGMSINDTSVVAFYSFGDWLFILPGDIETAGWDKLWAESAAKFQPLIEGSKYRVLVAPHHGRPTGYTESMMDVIKPSLILISDKYGKEDTDPRFRTVATGLPLTSGSEPELKKFFSTKTAEKIEFTVKSDGSCELDLNK